MILVAGSYDELKCQICFILASRGISIRTLIHHYTDQEWVDCLKNYGATLAVGDLRDPVFLSDLYLGVNAVICSPINLSTGHLDLIGMINFINAATAAGVLRFVYLSFADKDKDCIAQEKIEQRIIESGVFYTILQGDDYLSPVIGLGNQPYDQARIKDLARRVTQALIEPALQNTVVKLSDQAVDPHNQATVEGITGKIV